MCARDYKKVMGIPPEMLVNTSIMALPIAGTNAVNLAMPWYLEFARTWYQPATNSFLVPNQWFANIGAFAFAGCAWLTVRLLQMFWSIVCFVTKLAFKVNLNDVLLTFFTKLIK